MAMVTCQLCEQDVEQSSAICLNKNKTGDASQKAFYRCSMCNSLSSRIYRAKGRVQWESKEAKKDFFLQHATLAGNDLKQELEHATTQLERETTNDYDDADTAWLDEVDLQQKYKDKPDQLKSIMDTAETREHPTRKVTLYADINFSSKHSKRHEVEAETKRKCTSMETVKGAKKPKKEKPEKTEDKPLNKGQKAKLTKLEHKLEEIKVLWGQQQQCTHDQFLKTFLPQTVLESALKAMADVDACIAEVPLVLGDGWKGDFKAVLDRVTAAAEGGEASNGRVANLLEVAAEMKMKNNPAGP